MPPLGYMGAILDVDLTTGSHQTRELTQDMADRWLGGTGLGAHLLWEEQAYTADPLGPDNVMVWATGPFAGTAVPLSNRAGRALAHVAPIISALPSALQNLIDKLDRRGWRDEAALSVVNQLRRAADIRDDRHAAAEHRLDQ